MKKIRKLECVDNNNQNGCAFYAIYKFLFYFDIRTLRYEDMHVWVQLEVVAFYFKYGSIA